MARQRVSLLPMAEGPGTRRTRSFVAAGIVLALVVVMGVWVVVRGPGTGPAPAGVPHPATPAPVLEAGPPSHRPTAGSWAIPTVPPPGVTWRPYQGILLPYSTAAGPQSVGASLATGYAHTPTGALVAAVQIDYRHLLAPDWQVVTDQEVVADAGRTAYVSARTADATSAAATPPSTAPAAPSYRQVAGFCVVAYSATEALIQVVTVGTDGSYLMVPLTVRWIAGDWQLQLTPQGGDGPEAESLTTLAGFVAWGAA